MMELSGYKMFISTQEEKQKELIAELKALRKVAEAIPWDPNVNAHGEDCPAGEIDATENDDCECGWDNLSKALADWRKLK